MHSERRTWNRRFGLIMIALSSSGCANGFKQAVVQWAQGPSYSGPAQDLANDPELDDASKRIELMGYAGLACTIDEDTGASKPDKLSRACQCARPTDETAALGDCVAWATSLSGGGS
jgi:hypothetical protein